MLIAITMFDIAVLQPALKLTADFENGPVNTEIDVSQSIRLESHIPILQ